MDLDLVKKIIKIFEESEINELELEDDAGRIKLSKSKTEETIQQMPLPIALPQSIPIPPAPSASPSTPSSAEAQKAMTIDSPMVGTFYRAPAPDADPFINYGDKVTPDTVICIVEAMKIMNEIKADTSGTIKEILIENGQPVEFGQAMFVIDLP